MSDIITPDNGKESTEEQPKDQQLVTITSVNGEMFTVKCHTKNLVHLSMALKLLDVEITKMVLASQAGTPQPVDIVPVNSVMGQNILDRMRGFKR